MSDELEIHITINGPKGFAYATVPPIKEITQENEMPGDFHEAGGNLYAAYRAAKQIYDEMPEPSIPEGFERATKIGETLTIKRPERFGPAEDAIMELEVVRMACLAESRKYLHNELPPLIGTFNPDLGDVGRDSDNRIWAWEGKRWIDHRGSPKST